MTHPDNTCTRCGQAGHRASHCPWPNESRAHFDPTKPDQGPGPRHRRYMQADGRTKWDKPGPRVASVFDLGRYA